MAFSQNKHLKNNPEVTRKSIAAWFILLKIHQFFALSEVVLDLLTGAGKVMLGIIP